ncbi:MAG TPA: CBS domain-containing protein [Bacillota bacterium]|nr:CBS domain-containing protein [Bacillota bacterium]
MTQQVQTTRPEAGLREAAKQMTAAHISGLPVVDGDGRLAGILTEGDILRVFRQVSIPFYIDILGGEFSIPGPHVIERQLEEVTAYRVDQLMTRQVVTASPDEDVADAARRMHARDVKLLPVVDGDGRLVGVISRGDIVRTFAM